jgi:hypothetical protein
VAEDSGIKVDSTEHTPPTHDYEWGGEESFLCLKEKKTCSRSGLLDKGIHQACQRGISGNMTVGCDEIIVSGQSQSEDIVDTDPYVVYTATSRVGHGPW